MDLMVSPIYIMFFKNQNVSLKIQMMTFLHDKIVVYFNLNKY